MAKTKAQAQTWAREGPWRARKVGELLGIALVMSVLGAVQDAEAEAKAAFALYDTDGSGALSADELKAAVTAAGGDTPLWIPPTN